MDRNQKQEQFSIAYVIAMAAKVGLSYARPSVDNDSVDLSLSGRGYDGKVRSPQLDLQLKCTSRKEIIKDAKLHFPLKLKNYNDLRGEDLPVLRYLVVLIVPENIEKWLELKEDCLILRHLCY